MIYSEVFKFGDMFLWYSLFGSILTIGAMIGAITSGLIADFIGRKGAMRTAVAFCVAGWLAIYFAEGALALDLGRLSTGYGMGVFSYVLMITMGVSVSFLIGALATWQTLALIGLIPYFILIVGLFFMPESPRWLAKMGRQRSSKWPYGGSEIGVGLMVCQQFGGINGICFYVSEVFVSAGFPSDLGTAIYACLQVVVTALGATLIDKAGRRAFYWYFYPVCSY